MKSVLVTGASGLLGSHVVRLLFLAKKFIPIPMVRTEEQASEWRNLGLNPVLADLMNTTITLPKSIWAIIHTAAVVDDWVDKSAAFTVNVEGTHRLIESALKTDCNRFIHISTIGVYGHSPYTDATEEQPFKKTSVYENTKIKAEKVVNSYLDNTKGLKFIILRPPSMYGEGDRHIIPKYKKYIQKRKFLFINNGKNLYPIIHAADAAQAVLLSLQKDDITSGSKYHLSDDTRITLRRFIEILAENLNIEPKFRSIPFWPAFILSTFFEIAGKIRKKEPWIFRKRIKYLGRDRHVDITKAKEELGFQPKINSEIGISRTLKWIKEEEESLVFQSKDRTRTNSDSSVNIPFHLQKTIIQHSIRN
ncbi:MAG: NAD-dependent epimerase/dehydratase family protein [Candidatus Hodarchaeales archaeon]|jgi:nucleoside-diphosphate-sugar epimerase